MHYYQIHGLIFESDLKLPPLEPIAARPEKVDVSIRAQSIPETGLDSASLSSPYAQINSHSIWINIPDIARIQANNGNELLIDILDIRDEISARLFLFGSGIGAILHQRGNLVLHANAVLIEEKLILILGHSGAGKSTVAAAFNKQGYPVLSDDIVSVGSNLTVTGGFPQIKLSRDSLTKLDINQSGLKKVSRETEREIEKFALPVQPVSLEKPTPVSAVYILEKSDSNIDKQVEMYSIKGIKKFNNLKRHTYKKGFLTGLQPKATHLKISSALADSTFSAKIIRPQEGFHTEKIIEFILADLESRNQNKNHF